MSVGIIVYLVVGAFVTGFGRALNEDYTDFGVDVAAMILMWPFAIISGVAHSVGKKLVKLAMARR